MWIFKEASVETIWWEKGPRRAETPRRCIRTNHPTTHTRGSNTTFAYRVGRRMLFFGEGFAVVWLFADRLEMRRHVTSYIVEETIVAPCGRQ